MMACSLHLKLTVLFGLTYVSSMTITNNTSSMNAVIGDDKIKTGGEYNSKCTKTDECADTFFCNYGYCRCAAIDYFDGRKCNPKKTINTTCITSRECVEKLICRHDKCQCGSDLFWNGIQCNLRKSIKSYCNTSSECTENLQCITETCKCSDNSYWNGFVCEKRKSWTMNCTSMEECQETLFCAHEYCQCASSDFWEGEKCISRRAINSSCTLSEECSPSLQCINGNCRCCSSKFWNGTRCTTRLRFKSMCHTMAECQEGLQCQSNFCQCPANKYWSEKSCNLRKSIHAQCITADECQPSLSCIHKSCQCSADEHWAGATCDARKGLDTACNSDDECLSLYRCYDNTCQCKDGYYWDGVHCTKDCPNECSEVSSDVDGVYTICPKGSHRHISVYCMMRGLKKWTVIQRRFDGSVDFYRPWAEYKVGFGSAHGEYWLGNDNINKMTSNGNHKLSIYIEDWDGSNAYANYTTFGIGDEGDKYTLTVGGYSGTAGDSLAYHNGKPFSTYDSDNDSYSGRNCAVDYLGAWWFGNCNNSNLNGKNAGNASTIWWYHWKGAKSYKKSIMMVRK